jgi:hypothetical protein
MTVYGKVRQSHYRPGVAQRVIYFIYWNEYLLQLGQEFFYFHFSTEKCKDQITQNYTFSCCFVWV